MLCFASVTAQSKNDLNVLASGLLGLTGLSLLLFQSPLWNGTASISSWGLIALGIFCFSISLCMQLMLAIQMPKWSEVGIRASSILLLLVLSWLFVKGGQYIGAIVFLGSGIAQAFLFRSKNFNLLTGLTLAIGFTSGLCLVFIRGPYDFLNRPSLYILASLFLLTSLLAISSLFFSSTRYANILFRLQAFPWFVLSALLALFTPLPDLIPLLMFAVIILGTGLIPWERFILPEHDILGRRVLMVAGTLELTTLIFLSSLFSLLDSPITTQASSFFSARQAAFFFFIIISVVLYYQVSTIVMTINGLMSELAEDKGHLVEQSSRSGFQWNNRLVRYLKPFILTRDQLRIRFDSQADQITALSRQLSLEKKRNGQLILLNELSQQLENQLDQPVSAQLAVNTLERALDCDLANLYVHEEDSPFTLLAAAGTKHSLSIAENQMNISGEIISRAVRQRKTQIINDARQEKDRDFFTDESLHSYVIVPMTFNGHVNTILILASGSIDAFSSIDVELAESVAEELIRAWERSGYQQRLTHLIQSGSNLSSMVEPVTTAYEVAALAREILNARFTFVQIQLGQEGNFIQTAFSGDAPRLYAFLKDTVQGLTFIQTASNASQSFRVRDIRKYSATSAFTIDHPSLRSLLAIPIRWHRLSIGTILAFGKQNEVFFTENDESLAELLSIQAAGAFESTWLQQELRSSLRTTSLLYRLSTHIIQAESLQTAAVHIADTSHKLGKGESTGIVLFSSSNEIEAEVEIDSNGPHSSSNHPMQTIRQVMESGQVIYESQGQSLTRICLPIQTPIRKYGALWMNVEEDLHQNPASPADLQTLVNQSAIALERTLLLVESQNQAQELKNAYYTLEATYDQTLAALTSALDARDRETEGHSLRVSQLAAQLGEALGFSREQLKVLERGSLLHDIGKIGISDTILHKPGPLSEEEWKTMRHHPDIGAQIVQGIPFLEDTIPLIRYHQERWDGTGYPLGLKGDEIPTLARMFAVVDAYDALTSKRPYRDEMTLDEALRYLREHAGVLFDPHIVEVFENLIFNNETDLVPHE